MLASLEKLSDTVGVGVLVGVGVGVGASVGVGLGVGVGVRAGVGVEVGVRQPSLQFLTCTPVDAFAMIVLATS